MAYDYEDEETRRQRRNDETAEYNNGGALDPGRGRKSNQPWWMPDDSTFDDGYGDPRDGMGSPESGYGPGGVENPAYDPPSDEVFRGNLTPVKEATADEHTRMIDPRGYAPASPAPQNNQPTFLPPAPQMAAAPSAVPAATVAQPIATPAITSQLTKILQDRLKALSQPFDINQDDTYKQTVNAYGLGQERDARRQRKIAAERAAAGGYGSSGALNTKIQGIAERRGQNESMFAAQTASDRLKQRDDQLVVAIQLARAVGQDDLANTLEQQRLKLSEELGRADLALRDKLGMGQLALGAGQLGLGYDRLGFDYTSLANSANRDAILALLGGR